jgi:hypothetical protein
VITLAKPNPFFFFFFFFLFLFPSFYHLHCSRDDFGRADSRHDNIICLTGFEMGIIGVRVGGFFGGFFFVLPRLLALVAGL